MLPQDKVGKYPARTILPLLLSLVMLGSCAQVQLRTAWALKDVDYLTVDPGQFRLALSMPAEVRLDKMTMHLQFSYDKVVQIDHDIAFDILTSGSEVNRVPFPPSVSNGIVLRLPVSRLGDVLDYQRRLLRARELGEPASASMGVDSQINEDSLATACAVGNGEFRIQAWILVNDIEGYLPLIGESEIASLIDSQTETFCPQQTEAKI
jgi:hypothetical protein